MAEKQIGVIRKSAVEELRFTITEYKGRTFLDMDQLWSLFVYDSKRNCTRERRGHLEG